MMTAYLNDTLVDPSVPSILGLDAGFALGEGVLETMVARDGRIRLGHRHRSRLATGLQHLGIDMIDWDRIERRVASVRPDADQLLLRLVVTRGPLRGGFGADPSGPPTEFLTIRPFVPSPSPRIALLVDWPRRNPHSVRARFKCLGYADELLARRRALDAGADIAILKSTEGSIACFDSANLFVLTEGRLRTPPITDGALAGTVRSEILARGAIAGVPVVEATLTESDLERSSVVLLTNAGFGVAALQHIANLPRYAPSEGGLQFSQSALAELYPQA